MVAPLDIVFFGPYFSAQVPQYVLRVLYCALPLCCPTFNVLVSSFALLLAHLGVPLFGHVSIRPRAIPLFWIAFLCLLGTTTCTVPCPAYFCLVGYHLLCLVSVCMFVV